MTDEKDEEPLRFEVLPGETFTYDRGGDGPEIVLTASASANTALAALEIMPPSPIRDAARTAYLRMGDMSKAELKQEIAVLSAEGQVPDSKFGSLPVPTVTKLLELELEARKETSGEVRSYIRDFVMVGLGVAGAIVVGFLGFG